jgi:ABC-type transporter Mla MlaB component
MDPRLHHALEAHPGGATLYLAGALSVADALRAMRACDVLPAGVRALRLEMRGVELFDPAAVAAVVATLRQWRARSGGVTRVDVPRGRTFVSLGGGPVGLRARRGRAAGARVFAPPTARRAD